MDDHDIVSRTALTVRRGCHVNGKAQLARRYGRRNLIGSAPHERTGDWVRRSMSDSREIDLPIRDANQSQAESLAKRASPRRAASYLSRKPLHTSSAVKWLSNIEDRAMKPPPCPCEEDLAVLGRKRDVTPLYRLCDKTAPHWLVWGNIARLDRNALNRP